MIVGGRGAKESKVGGGVRNRLGGEAVEQIGSSGQPLGLVAGGREAWNNRERMMLFVVRIMRSTRLF